MTGRSTNALRAGGLVWWRANGSSATVPGGRRTARGRARTPTGPASVRRHLPHAARVGARQPREPPGREPTGSHPDVPERPSNAVDHVVFGACGRTRMQSEHGSILLLLEAAVVGVGQAHVVEHLVPIRVPACCSRLDRATSSINGRGGVAEACYAHLRCRLPDRARRDGQDLDRPRGHRRHRGRVPCLRGRRPDGSGQACAPSSPAIARQHAARVARAFPVAACATGPRRSGCGRSSTRR